MSDLAFIQGSSSSESFDTNPSKVSGLFLVKFDVKIGYNMVWSKSLKGDIDLDGLEYKSLPSGIQEESESTILFSHISRGKRYLGLSRFRQKILGEYNEEEHRQLNRNDVEMYSLGVLCESVASDWKPNEYMQNGWEYIDDLDNCLKAYLEKEKFGDYSLFDDLFTTLTSTLRVNDSTNISNHLLSSLPYLFKTLGPLVFLAYKQSLLRKRIVIFNNHLSKVDNFSCGTFCYLITLLSVLPRDMDIYTPHVRRNVCSDPVYNIGLNDLDKPILSSSYIASTNDDVLRYQKELYDCAIFLPAEGNSDTLFFESKDVGLGSLDLNKRQRATLKDYSKFKQIYREIFYQKYIKSQVSTDDLASIKTSNSVLSYFRSERPEKEPEPTWWVRSATSPMSWSEYIWSAFSWFASAGQVSETSQNNNIDAENNADRATQRNRLFQMVSIVGYFHKLTKKWFYIINEVLLEELESQGIDIPSASAGSASPSSDKSIHLELTYQDIVDMELDPYSDQDLQFAKEFVLTYWGSIVDEVSIGIGLTRICC